MSLKSCEDEIEDTPTEEEMSYGKLELTDLPEPVLLHIMSYLSHDFLRDVVSNVNIECRRLAHSKVLWTRASLRFDFFRPCDDFIRKILATPYLHLLSVPLRHCKENTGKSRILAALVSTRCRLHKLDLTVDDYSQEILLFLQRHPELRELKLWDTATENDYTAGVAATVGRLAPGLISLNLSNSSLLHFLRTGLLLAPPSPPHGEYPHWNPSECSISIPEAFEPLDPQGGLDLQNVEDDENGVTVKREQPQGLLHFEFFPVKTDFFCPMDPSATTGRNLSALLHLHKHALKSATVHLPCEDVLMALAECKKLEELSVLCDPDGSGLCGMLQAMEPTLRCLKLYAQDTMGAGRLAAVLQTLCRHAPRLEVLELNCWKRSSKRAMEVFPGFKHLLPLLVGRGGSAGTLREVRINPTACFVGRAQLLELASLFAANGELSLRKLKLGAMFCSEDDDRSQCREKAYGALRTAAPSLHVSAECICYDHGHGDTESESESYDGSVSYDESDMEV